jgi:hypothetical protein
MDNPLHQLEIYFYFIGHGDSNDDDMDPLDRVQFRHPQHMSDEEVSEKQIVQIMKTCFFRHWLFVDQWQPLLLFVMKLLTVLSILS